MKILFYCSKFPPLAGGGGVDVFQTGSFLTNKKHDVYVVCEHMPGLKKYEKLNERFHVYRVQVPVLKNRGSGLYFLMLCFLIAVRGIRLIIKEKIDILHCNDTATGLAALLTKMVTRKASVFKFAGSMTYEYLNNANKKDWDPALGERWVWENARGFVWVMLFFEKQFFTRFDRIFTNAAYLVDLLDSQMNLPEGKVKLIYNGVDTDKLDPEKFRNIKEKLGVNRLIYTGIRFVKYKGVDLLVKACLPMLAKWDAHLLIAGDGPQEEEIRKLVNNNERVRLLGNIEWKENITHVRSADVFVLPSLVDKSPPCIMEALSLGTPCIASDIDGVRELIGENAGILVTPNDPDQLRDKIDWMLNNEKEAAEMGSNGRRFMQKEFSLEKKHEAVLNVYRELLEEKNELEK